MGREPAAGELAPFARGGALSVAGAIVGAGLSFAFVVAVGRLFGPAGTGVLFQAIALFTIAATVVLLGADTGLVRMVSRLRALDRAADVRTTIGVALGPPLVGATLLAVAAAALAPQIAAAVLTDVDVDEGARLIRVLVAFLPFSVATTLLLSATRGFGAMRPFVAVQHALVPLLRLVLLAVLVVGAGLGGVAAGVAWAVPLAVGSAVAALATIRRARRVAASPGAAHGGSRGALAGEFWRFAAPRGLGSALQTTTLWIDIVLVGALVSTQQAGIYSAANRYVWAGATLTLALGIAIAPAVSSLLATGSRERAQTLYQTGTWWLMAGSWPLNLTLAVFAPFFMGVFGPAFSPGSTALLILALALLVYTGTGNNKIVLLMGGGSAVHLAITAVVLGLNIGGNLVLIPRHGLLGAAIAWAVTITVDNALTTLVVWRRLGLHPFGTGYAIVAGAAVVCYGGIALAVRTLMSAESVAAVLVAAVLGGAVYGAVLWRYRARLHLDVMTAALRPSGRGGGRQGPARVR